MLKVGAIVLLAECLTPLQIRSHIKDQLLWDGLVRDAYQSGSINKEVKWLKVRGTTLILYV